MRETICVVAEFVKQYNSRKFFFGKFRIDRSKGAFAFLFAALRESGVDCGELITFAENLNRWQRL